MTDVRFNPPPGWPHPPAGWEPPANWTPDPTWPPAPPDWQFWVPVEDEPPDVDGVDRDPFANGYGTHQPVGTGRHAAPATSSAAGTAMPVVTGRHAARAATDPVLSTAAPGLGPPPSRPELQRHEPRDTESPAQHPTEIERRIRALEQEESALQDRIRELRELVALQDAGFHDYHHPLENADQYKPLLADLQARMTELIKLGRAVLTSGTFSYDNSLARGQKLTSDFSRLMLRAYNAEADSILRSLRAGDAPVAVKRLENTANTIARLGAAMDLRIAPEYHELRLREIRLTADHLLKIQEQREAAREERARMRDEQKAQQQFAQERARLDRERKRVLEALPVVEGQNNEAESAELRERLAQIDAAIEQNERQAAELRAGYLYVASNIGAFGTEIVKIGVTRMLDPEERVRELGDESVPFPFDLHVVSFADDAVALARDLRAQFESRRVNYADPRREFFFATPREVRDALAAKVGHEVDFVEAPDAIQYYQSRGRWQEELPD